MTEEIMSLESPGLNPKPFPLLDAASKSMSPPPHMIQN
jgi:hypothetical protein